MITKKIVRKHSIEYVLIDGHRYFKFTEYTDDAWFDKKMYRKQTKPYQYKGDTTFFYEMQQTMMPVSMWSKVESEEPITTLKRAKQYVRNREYM